LVAIFIRKLSMILRSVCYRLVPYEPIENLARIHAKVNVRLRARS
jgi:hypothetical protein